jgi:hypothetical protein
MIIIIKKEEFYKKLRTGLCSIFNDVRFKEIFIKKKDLTLESNFQFKKLNNDFNKSKNENILGKKSILIFSNGKMYRKKY